MKAGAQALVPTLEGSIFTDNAWSTLGLGWLGACLVLSGSPDRRVGAHAARRRRDRPDAIVHDADRLAARRRVRRPRRRHRLRDPQHGRGRAARADLDRDPVAADDDDRLRARARSSATSSSKAACSTTSTSARRRASRRRPTRPFGWAVDRRQGLPARLVAVPDRARRAPRRLRDVRQGAADHRRRAARAPSRRAGTRASGRCSCSAASSACSHFRCRSR